MEPAHRLVTGGARIIGSLTGHANRKARMLGAHATQALGCSRHPPYRPRQWARDRRFERPASVVTPTTPAALSAETPLNAAFQV